MINYLLIAGCAAVFGYELTLGPEASAFIEAHAFVPEQLRLALGGEGDLVDVLRRALASMFIHAGWFHVIGNVLYLRVFGDNIEDQLGHVRYLLFYLACGLAGVIGQYLAAPQNDVPMVGASGAIAGVMGAYLVLFPRARIVTLFPVLIFLTFIEVPAILFLGLWSIQQLMYGWLSLDPEAKVAGGVAWFAHIGGLSVGVLVGARLRWTRLRAKRR